MRNSRRFRILLFAIMLSILPSLCAASGEAVPVVVSGAEPIPTPIPLVTPAPTTRELPAALHPEAGRHTIRWPNGLPLPYHEGQDTLTIYITQMAAFDCFTVVCGGEAAMIDCGSTRNVYDVLRAAGVKRLKFAFNTHPHGDHENGFPELLTVIPTDVLYTRFPPDYDDEQRKLMREMKNIGVRVEVLEQGASLSVGGAQLTLYDVMNRHRITNNQSTMVLIRFGERSLLLTADIGRIAQEHLNELYGSELDVDILKIPHHGLELLSEPFVNAASPEEVFITYRYIDNVTEQCVTQLKRMGFDPLYAGLGTLKFTTDGGDYWFIEQLPYVKLPD